MILHCDAKTIPLSYVQQCDVMITDPPYREHVHAKATSQSPRRGARHRDMGFSYLDPTLRRCIGRWAATVKRWSVIYSDVEASTWLRLSCEGAGAGYIRTMPWVRWSMPQLSGDRPGQGFEHVLLFHQAGREGRTQWNGPGSVTHLAHKALRGETKHKAEKPLDQCLDLVSWFSNPGECVFDPFAGRGSIGRACQILGREYLGLELDATWAEKATERLASPLSSGEAERVQRYLDCEYQKGEPEDEPAKVRKARRDADKATAKRVLEARSCCTDV